MRFRDLSIRKRITLSNVSMIAIPVLILAVITPIFLRWSGDFLKLDSLMKNITTSSAASAYLQWGDALDQLTASVGENELSYLRDPAFQEKIRSMEKSGSQILLERGDETLYLTPGQAHEALVNQAKQISGQEPGAQANMLYTGGNGMVASAQMKTMDNQTIRIMVVNPQIRTEFGYHDQAGQDVNHFFSLRLGMVILGVAVIFILTIAVLSFLTSGGIVRPLEKLKRGTNEITKGNLDFRIDYESKNEIGQVVSDFDLMRARLKDSSERQQRLENSRKEMIAGFSHDLRTPLTSIKGYLEGLMDGIANTPEKQERYLKTIYSSTCDMEKLVSELFLFSKLDVDRVSLDLENVNIVNYLQDCCEEQKAELEQEKMKIHFRYYCDIMTLVAMDRNKFNRVILNIISNSVKYKKPGWGHLDIAVSKDDYNAFITLEDDGVGVPPSEARYIFDTFYRVDQARSKVSEGSGLGLSICKQIVELHGGKIWADGKLNEGLTIHIALPLLQIKGEKNDEQKSIDH